MDPKFSRTNSRQSLRSSLMRTLHLMAYSLLFITATFAHSIGSAMESSSSSDPAILPQPRHLIKGVGNFTLNRNTVLVYAKGDSDLLPCASALTEAIRRSTGYSLRVLDAKSTPKRNFILLALQQSDSLGSEGYGLNVKSNEVVIHAQTAQGVFYGIASLLQLFPPTIYSEKPVKTVSWKAPCCTIADSPRYTWRGMHLDVSRHFFPKEFVKRFIDYLAMHKMNTFHWHLTDDQGWRIEIKKYPELTTIGAWRVDHEDVNWSNRPPQKPGEKATVGGFYTQNDIREVVLYAAKKFITVVPEIEMPAHATAVITAYPQYSCTGGPFTVPPGGLWPIKDIFCAGNDATFEFVQDVLTEVASLFPSPYIHIGGDEANKAEWKRCPKCQARIRDEHLANEDELQSYFIKRVEKILTGLGKRLIGWDEILEGGLAPQATVMSWRGIGGGIAAARSGHDVIMSPTSYCYFDYYQATPRGRPLAIGGYLPLERAYSFDPTPDSLTPAEARHILGVQGNLWSEYIPNPAQLEYMAFPRIAAMAENGWCQKETKSWPEFLTRLGRQLDRYSAMHINYSPSLYEVEVQESVDPALHNGTVTLQSQSGVGTFRYTLDGTEPSVRSRKYTEPITIKKSTTITAVAFDGTRKLSGPTTRTVLIPQQQIQSLTCDPPMDSVYAARGLASLGNGRRGVASRDDASEWRGITAQDLAITVDLGEVVPVARVTAGFLNQANASIFLPSQVTFAASVDGKLFTEIGQVTCKTLQKDPIAYVKDCSVSAKKTRARFIRITAKNPGPVPEWDLRAGRLTTILSDEIIIE
jgi:hexosaminidase